MSTQSGAGLTHQLYQLPDLAIGWRLVAMLVVHPAQHPGQVLGGGTYGANGKESESYEGVQA